MTSSREDYLKAIARLQQNAERVSNRHIADDLGVSAASVSEIIRKMEKEGLVESVEKRSIRLTRKGEETAVRLVRIHRLWEVFLVDHLGYAWEDVHEEAEKLEHAASPQLMEKLDRFLGYPEMCPHGRKIPGRENRGVPEGPLSRLSDLPAGIPAVVRRVPESRELLEILASCGIRLHEKVALLEEGAHCGAFLVEAREGRRLELPVAAADAVLVEISA